MERLRGDGGAPVVGRHVVGFKVSAARRRARANELYALHLTLDAVLKVLRSPKK